LQGGWKGKVKRGEGKIGERQGGREMQEKEKGREGEKRVVGLRPLAKIPVGAHGLQKFDLMRHFFV